MPNRVGRIATGVLLVLAVAVASFATDLERLWAYPAAAIPDNLQQVAAIPFDSVGNHAENADTGALLNVTAGTTAQNSSDQVNTVGRGVQCLSDVTIPAGSNASLTTALQSKDTASGKYTTFILGPAMAASSSYMLTAYPGVASTAAGLSNPLATNQVVPRTWRVAVAVANAASATYTIGCSVIQ